MTRAEGSACTLQNFIPFSFLVYFFFYLLVYGGAVLGSWKLHPSPQPEPYVEHSYDACSVDGKIQG